MYGFGPTNMAANDFTSERKMLNPNLYFEISGHWAPEPVIQFNSSLVFTTTTTKLGEHWAIPARTVKSFYRVDLAGKDVMGYFKILVIEMMHETI